MGHVADTKPWIPMRLVVPWSSRVAFSTKVCGLPGEKGCWRHRACKDLDVAAAHDLMDRSIASSRPPRPTRSRWVAFLRPADGGPVEQVFASTRAAVDRCRMRSQTHVVVFEFDRSAAELRPHSYECRTWFGGHHEAIVDWWNPESPVPSLFQCFGKELFVQWNLSPIPGAAQASIADLIQGFLDQGCPWFRQHRRGPHFGVAWCHLEVHLLQRSVEEDVGPIRLSDYLVTFSLIDPSTLRVEYLSEPSILNLDPDGEFCELRQVICDAIQLRAHSDDGKSVDAVCFADCLTGSREQILASEIDSSFLRFSIPEVTLYLLDWLLSRILARGVGHQEVAKHLQRLVDGEGELSAVEDLLEAEIRLDIDPRVFRADALRRLDPNFEPLLGIFPEAVSFRSVLETIDLHNGGEPLVEAARFLANEFLAGGKVNNGHRDLPMFADLGWIADRRLAEEAWYDLSVDESKLDVAGGHALEVLAAVIRSVARRHIFLSPEEAEERARQLVRKSVFPIAHLLTHWPSQKGVRNYFIFPIWESLIGDDYRPSIFAHVFSSRRGKPEEEEGTAIRDEARLLNIELQPFGRLIAQSTYDTRLRRSQIDSRLASAAYSIGHPMKRRVDSVHAVLNSMLDLEPQAESAALIHEAGEAASRVGRLGHVLDVLADALRSGEPGRIFQRKKDWRQEQPYHLKSLLADIDGRCLAPGVRPVTVEVAESTERARIGCWMTDGEGLPYRPADLFYEELVFELFLNAAKHGLGDRSGVPVEVQCRKVTVNGASALAVTLVNGIDVTEAVEATGWTMWNEHGDAPVGGLYFLASLLDQTGLGCLWTRVEKQRKTACFAVALELNGLERM